MACRGCVIALVLVGALLIPQIAALKGCNQACSSNDQCVGQLACMNGNCNDDPGVGTHICAGASPPPRSTPSPPRDALGGCNHACTSNDQCSGQLACMNGKCNDDPSVGTHICANAPPSPPPQGGNNTCQPSGYITGITSDQCNTGHMSDCCKAGDRYGKYYCSPPITAPATKAILTVNGFGQGQDGGGAPECTPDQYYRATDSVVALSTGWFNNYARCGKRIRIHGNGQSTIATVVDECDSRAGCDKEHAYQPPCKTDIVDASEAVWRALGVAESEWGEMAITWSQID